MRLRLCSMAYHECKAYSACLLGSRILPHFQGAGSSSSGTNVASLAGTTQGNLYKNIMGRTRPPCTLIWHIWAGVVQLQAYVVIGYGDRRHDRTSYHTQQPEAMDTEYFADGQSST